MALSYKTPGVYIEEKNAFPNSVVAVATAVPAFIGYTRKAEKLGKVVTNKPIRVTSLVEFEQFFGGEPDYKFSVVPKDTDEDKDLFPLATDAGRTEHKIKWVGGVYRLYNSIRHFYQNGGGTCWIVSVGGYDGDKVEKAPMQKAVGMLEDEPEPTMVLCPDALTLEEPADCFSIYTAILAHCKKMQSRVGIFDVPGGNSEVNFDSRDVIAAFHNGIGTNFLDYGAAYFPWLETNVVSDREITLLNFDETLGPLITPAEPAELNAAIARELKTVAIPDKPGMYTVTLEKDGGEVEEEVDEAGLFASEARLRGVAPVYKSLIIKEAVKKINLLPPAPAMAGIYTAVDNTRGVWKAPANVSMNSVMEPNVNINNDLNDDLNVPLNGKAVNAIRSFPGQGVIVWGARTLDGNSQDWRYINVRRTMIFLEMSIKAAARAYVFEPNDANTWILLQGMISNFLNNVWKAGALFGSTPGEAYDVQVGLGTTMTANDILDGYMRVTVRVAIVRPAEFIVITFQQKMAEA